VKERRARDIRAALNAAYPAAEEITVTPETDGARIVIEVGGQSQKYSIGDGRSALLSKLLTGYPD
jgi:hypothetical protein